MFEKCILGGKQGSKGDDDELPHSLFYWGKMLEEFSPCIYWLYFALACVSIPEDLMPSQTGKLSQGCLKTSRNNFLEANVLVEGMEKSVLIQGRLNINRALNDDTVAVELLPEDQWCRPANVIIDQEKQEEENKGWE